MPTLKSRVFDCPDSLMTALVEMEVSRASLVDLARVLRHQAALFKIDEVVLILEETADEIQDHTTSIDALKLEMSAFLSSLS